VVAERYASDAHFSVPTLTITGPQDGSLATQTSVTVTGTTNGRSIPMNMGKVLGGGSSINLMAWSRGHKNDWDYFAPEAGDPAKARGLTLLDELKFCFGHL